MRNEQLTVGIMGGMGPDATVDLMQRIIKLTPASDDVDHIRLLVDNNPKIPSRIKALIEGTGESPLPALIEMAQGLQNAGADCLVIACNTAHHYFSDIRDRVSIPMLNTIEISTSYLSEQKPSPKKIGLLASTAVQQVRLFEPYLSREKVDVVYPDPENQRGVMTLIKRIKAQSIEADDRDILDCAIQSLSKQGAECILIACTELSYLSPSLNTSLRVFDTADILAKSVVRKALGSQLFV